MSEFDYLTAGLRTIDAELAAVEALRALGRAVCTGLRPAARYPGRVIVLGMGKSGHIGRKIAATLASTGTPAFLCTRRKLATAISA